MSIGSWLMDRLRIRTAPPPSGPSPSGPSPSGPRRPVPSRLWTSRVGLSRVGLSRVGLVVGVLLLGAGVFGGWHAGNGVHSTSVRVAGIPVELVGPVGPVGRGTGRPVVVIAHGYAGSGRLMRPFADTLARRGYLVALPDLAGHAGNSRALTVWTEVDRDLVDVVRYVRGLPEVDPERVALLGHSMGAAAVVRVGAADPSIAATVAISLGDDAAAALRPGPRHLLLIVGALEPAGLPDVSERALAGTHDGRRMVRVPMVEHIGVLYADRTHREAAHWLDDTLRHRPERQVIAAKERVAGGGLSLAGMLLLVIAVLIRSAPRGMPSTAAAQPATPTREGPVLPARGVLGLPARGVLGLPARGALGQPTREGLAWLGGAVLVAPVPGLVGGWLLARTLPNAVCGHLIGYFAFTGATLAIAALLLRRRTGGRSSGDNGEAPTGVRRYVTSWMAAGSTVALTVALTVAGSAAVLVPIQFGLTSVVPYGPRWWLIAFLALATATLLGGAHALAGPPWSVVVLFAVWLPLPVAAAIGLAPSFLVLVAPLIAALLALHLLVAGIAWLAGVPWWRTVPAGALVAAWPVAAVLPIG